MKLLWLASWYPNRSSPYNGDFIMRHAEAVSLHVEKLTVLAVVKDDSLAPGAVSIEKQQQENLEHIRVYYGRSRWLPEKMGSLMRSFQLQLRFYRQWCRENGKPAFLHVHVPVKAGLLALYCRYFQRIPYIVTEHWAGYDAASHPGIRQKEVLFRFLNAWILRKAAAVVAVSKSLAAALGKHYPRITGKVIPNVVNTRIFYPAAIPPSDVLRLIHVSGMDYQKNPEDMLRALSIWKSRGGCFMLACYGQAPETLKSLAAQLGLEKEIQFHGEAPQPEIAAAMRQADALVLYSRFETFGCVIIEAHACGIPVIVSELPVFHETVVAGQNGLFAQGENPEALAGVFATFSQTRYQYNREQIAAEAARRFGYQPVARQILEVYRSVSGTQS